MPPPPTYADMVVRSLSAGTQPRRGAKGSPAARSEEGLVRQRSRLVTPVYTGVTSLRY
jgi:hypothetical protein